LETKSFQLIEIKATSTGKLGKNLHQHIHLSCLGKEICFKRNRSQDKKKQFFSAWTRGQNFENLKIKVHLLARIWRNFVR